MSVFVLSREDYGKLYSFIRYDDNIRTYFYSFREHWLKGDQAFKKNTKAQELDIKCFLDRCFIANQLAFEYTYSQDEQHTIDRLNEKDLENGSFTSKKEFLKKLQTLKYNLATNGGRTFLGPEDTQRLNRVLNMVKEEILRGLN